MSNSLTGDYEAVLEVAIRQINGVLGTLHQNAEPQNRPPWQDQPPVAEFRVVSFPFPTPPALQTPHSLETRIAERIWTPPVDPVFVDWVVGFQRAGPGRSVQEIRKELTATAPPGAARMLAEAFTALDRGWQIPPPPPRPGQVQGLAKIQASSVKISVAAGSSSEITVIVNIRAAYYPDPNTTNLPAPIHGDIQAAFEVQTTELAYIKRRHAPPNRATRTGSSGMRSWRKGSSLSFCSPASPLPARRRRNPIQPAPSR
jgi:hypothetical protein